MKRRMSRLTVLIVLLLAAITMSPVMASFTSLRVFGDGVCTTTTNGSNLPYYGDSYCNGRVWIEVIAQWQGVTYNAVHNKSYFGHDSIELLGNINSFTPPADIATALFVIWCANADFVEFTQVNTPPYNSGDQAPWTTFINLSINRHVQAVTNLYNLGARTIVMPNAADISSTPYYELSSSDNAFIRARAIQFNAAFNTALTNLLVSKPGLVIHRPDTFALFDQVLANPASFGITKTNIDAFSDLGNPTLTGPGANYLFWDYSHPTAKFQMHLAALVQQIISPVKVNGLTVSGASGQLTVANIPLGRQGIVQGTGTLQAPWTQDATFTVPFTAGASTTGSVTVPTTAARRFYRVNFPVVWTYP